jgi:L-alanine-DL-glutamate epimerase-like enolase superfamily enzyme
MRITDITADPLTLGTTLVRLHTDEGPVGLGQFISRWENAPAYAAWFIDRFKPKLVGRDPFHSEGLWEELFFFAGGRYGAQQVAAIDMASLDLQGKATGRPIYDLLGGAARTEIPMYWSIGSGFRKSPEEMRADVEKGWESGFRAFKIRMDWHELRLDTNPEKDFAMFTLCREFLPEGIPLGFDANGGYTVSTAIRQGMRMEALGIAHFEEPVPPHDLRGLRQVADALTVPVSAGEFEISRWRFRDMIDIGNPDILQPDILNAGGPTEVKRICDLAQVYSKPVMPHSPDAGIASFASLHVFATQTNGTLPHEYSPEGFDWDVQRVQALFEEPILPVDGKITLSDKPGLGLTLIDEALQKVLI